MPIVVHGSAETLRILRSHIFNWLVWQISRPSLIQGNPFLRFQEMRTGESTLHQRWPLDRRAAGAAYRSGGGLPPEGRGWQPGFPATQPSGR